jgi:hypothetical protein
VCYGDWEAQHLGNGWMFISLANACAAGFTPACFMSALTSRAKAQTGAWKLLTCNKRRCATKPHSSFCTSIHWSSAQPRLPRYFPCATRHWVWKWLHWSRLRYIYSVQTEPIAGSNTTKYWTFTMPNSIFSLPPELLSRILEYLAEDRRDISSSRLVNNAFKAASSPFLITEVVFAKRLPEIAKLHEVACQ